MYTAAYAAYKRWYLESKTLDPLECPRVQTVSVLWERIQEHHVVHVRATPASGKSTLSSLLEQHVKRKHPGSSRQVVFLADGPSKGLFGNRYLRSLVP